jgi:hypothetical protein
MDAQAAYERQHTPEDYREGWKVGSTQKIYIPSLKMADFSTLLRFLEARYKS